MTPYQTHRKRWRKCTSCELHERRNQVVLARGRVPAPVLFIGEAPGASEDVIGRPFVGPAGKLLDRVIERAIDGRCDYAITNLVACIPKGEDGAKAVEPSKACIMHCKERLQEFVALCKPKLVVCVGKLAAKWVPNVIATTGEWAVVEIIHPAAILRMNVAQQGLAMQRAMIVVSDAVDELCGG